MLTPYGEPPDTYFTEHGYLSIAVQLRGTAYSGGTVGWYGEQDAVDGLEIVDWAAHLPESNGEIGLHGCFYRHRRRGRPAGPAMEADFVREPIEAEPERGAHSGGLTQTLGAIAQQTGSRDINQVAV